MSLVLFPQFSRLPIELRLRIWKETIVPRVIRIKFEPDVGFISDAKLPIAFEVCHESRQFALPQHTKVFGSIFYHVGVHVNYSIDTIYLPNDLKEMIPMFFHGLKEYDVNSIRYLAFDDITTLTMNDDDPFVDSLRSCVKCLTGLKELIAVRNIQMFFWQNGIKDIDSTWKEVDEHNLEVMHIFRQIPQSIVRHSNSLSRCSDVSITEMPTYVDDWEMPKTTLRLVWPSNLHLHLVDKDGTTTVIKPTHT